jgi:glycosyltransferase involved in cell wall biosynthesis
MRIIQVVNVRWFNATAWYGLFLAELLAGDGHNVLVLTQAGTETHRESLKRGLPTATPPLNSKNPLVAVTNFFALARLLSDYAPDVVNCHRGESFVHFALLKKLRGGFGLVRTRGDRRPPRNSRLNQWLHKECADAVVVTNSDMARHFSAEFGLPDDQLRLILGGVDRQLYSYDGEGRARVREELGFGPDDRVVGLLGRFDEVKGQKETIRAVARLRGEGFDRAKLMLLGFETATSEKQVREWIEENQLEQTAVITGKRSDPAACISAMDLGVVSSLYSEAIARAALEIMSCGVPLVGTRVGVMPDLLRPEALAEP